MITKPDDMERTTVKRRGKHSTSFGALLAVLILLILAVGGYIAYLLYGYYSAESEYDMVREGFVEPAILEDEPEPEPDSPFPDRDIDIEGLLSQNPDFVCWLYYPDGKVDYPVVQEHEDNINEYLHTTFDKKSNSAGCIFMPYDNSADFSDLNTFLYGHNMKDGSMFGSLKYLYRDPKENFKDPYFYIWTKDYERIMYRVVAMYVVDKDSEMYSVPQSAAGYVEYKDMMMSMGSVDGFVKITDEELDAMGHGAPIVSLSVCYGPAGTRNRLLVQGVEILREDFGDENRHDGFE